MDDKLAQLFRIFDSDARKTLFPFAITKIVSYYEKEPDLINPIINWCLKLLYTEIPNPMLGLERRQIAAKILEATYEIYTKRLQTFYESLNLSLQITAYSSFSDFFYLENLSCKGKVNDWRKLSSEGVKHKIYTLNEVIQSEFVDLIQIDMYLLFEKEQPLLGTHNDRYLNSQNDVSEAATLEKIASSLMQSTDLMEELEKKIQFNSNSDDYQSEFTAVEYLPAKRRKIDTKSNETNDPSMNLDDLVFHNYFDILYKNAQRQLFSPEWRIRYSAALVLRSLAKSNINFLCLSIQIPNDTQNLSREDEQGEICDATDVWEKLHIAFRKEVSCKERGHIIMKDIFTRNLILLALDRYTDFLSEKSNIIVRGISCQIIEELWTSYEQAFDKEFLALIFINFTIMGECQFWQTQQGLLQLFLRLLSDKPDRILSFYPTIFEKLHSFLATDTVEDVLYLAAECLLLFYRQDNVIEQVQTKQLMIYVSDILNCLQNCDDINSSAAMLLQLLNFILQTPRIQEFINNQLSKPAFQMQKAIDSLLHLFVHKTKEARIALLSAIDSTFLQKSQANSTASEIKSYNQLSQQIWQMAIFETDQDVYDNLTIIAGRDLMFASDEQQRKLLSLLLSVIDDETGYLEATIGILDVPERSRHHDYSLTQLQATSNIQYDQTFLQLKLSQFIAAAYLYCVKQHSIPQLLHELGKELITGTAERKLFAFYIMCHLSFNIAKCPTFYPFNSDQLSQLLNEKHFDWKTLVNRKLAIKKQVQQLSLTVEPSQILQNVIETDSFLLPEAEIQILYKNLYSYIAASKHKGLALAQQIIASLTQYQEIYQKKCQHFKIVGSTLFCIVSCQTTQLLTQKSKGIMKTIRLGVSNTQYQCLSNWIAESLVILSQIVKTENSLNDVFQSIFTIYKERKGIDNKTSIDELIKARNDENLIGNIVRRYGTIQQFSRLLFDRVSLNEIETIDLFKNLQNKEFWIQANQGSKAQTLDLTQQNASKLLAYLKQIKMILPSLLHPRLAIWIHLLVDRLQDLLLVNHMDEILKNKASKLYINLINAWFKPQAQNIWQSEQKTRQITLGKILDSLYIVIQAGLTTGLSLLSDLVQHCDDFLIYAPIFAVGVMHLVSKGIIAQQAAAQACFSDIVAAIIVQKSEVEKTSKEQARNRSEATESNDTHRGLIFDNIDVTKQSIRNVEDHTSSPEMEGIDNPYTGFPLKLQNAASQGRIFIDEFRTMSKTQYELQVPVQTVLRDYQIEGVKWLGFLTIYGLNGALCDDMGLGKTIQILAIIQNEIAKQRAGQENNSWTPNLIIAPTTVTLHWVDEIRKFFTLRDVKVYCGTDTRGQQNQWDEADILIFSYGSFSKKFPSLMNLKINFLIVDEAHLIRNSKLIVTRQLKQISAAHRFVLSGTPIQNGLQDLWSLFDFLMPGYLGSEAYFRKKYQKLFSYNIFNFGQESLLFTSEQEDILSNLHRKVMPFILKRTKDQILKDLPPKVIQDYNCEMSIIQAQLYEKMITIYESRKIKKQTDIINEPKKLNTQSMGQENESKTPESAFWLIQSSRKLLSNPYQFMQTNYLSKKNQSEPLLQMQASIELQRDYRTCGKLAALKRILNDFGYFEPKKDCHKDNLLWQDDSQQKILIFSQFKESLYTISAKLLDPVFPDVRYEIISGELAPTQRFRLIKEFSSTPNLKILLLTTQTGGHGINLSAASIVIMYDHDYNPMNDLQAMDRAHRIGQQNCVQVFRLITAGTIEENILGLQRLKLNIASEIINLQNRSIENLEASDIQNLLTTSNYIVEADEKARKKDETIQRGFLSHDEALFQAIDYTKEF